MSNKDLAAQLAAVTAKAVNDDPHNEKSIPKKDKNSRPKPKAKSLTTKKEQGGGRERTAVALSPFAVDALREIELFLITECGARGMNASAATDIALQLTASNLKKEKDRIQELLVQLRENDGRKTRHKFIS